jgi:hypothetical protein
LPVATEISFARERVRDLWDELVPLMAAHLAEREDAGELPPLDIDRVQYEVLDALGKHRAFTARADGELVGYASFVVTTSLHHRTDLRAMHDALYLLPGHRSGLAGIQLIAFADRELRAEQVSTIHHVAPAGSPLGRALERMGNRPHEMIYVKRLHAGQGG